MDTTQVMTVTNGWQGFGRETFAFLRDKFEVLLLFVLAIIILSMWLRSDYNQNVKEVLMFALGAMTSLMRVIPRPNQNIKTDTVNAENVEKANTESGDIIAKDIVEESNKKIK